MDTFTTNDFWWKHVVRDEDEVKKAIEVLNSLTEEQKAAVRLYGQSCNCFGFDEGNGSEDM